MRKPKQYIVFDIEATGFRHTNLEKLKIQKDNFEFIKKHRNDGKINLKGGHEDISMRLSKTKEKLLTKGCENDYDKAILKALRNFNQGDTVIDSDLANAFYNRLKYKGEDGAQTEIIQIHMAIVKNDDIVKEESIYLKPKNRDYVPGVIEELTHITTEMLADKPHLNQDIAEHIFCDMFKEGKLPIVAHNGKTYDIPLLNDVLEPYGYHIDTDKAEIYDTMQLGRKLGEKKNTLDDWAKRLHINLDGLPHNAQTDVHTTKLVFDGICDIYDKVEYTYANVYNFDISR